MKSKILVLLFTIVLFSIHANANIEYSSETIPEHLKKNATCVIRKNINELTLDEKYKYRYKKTFAITILNEKAKHHGNFSEYYNRHNLISNISIKYFNKNGELIESIKKNKIIDINNADAALFDDYRVKFFESEINEYPYTMEYQYEMISNSFLQYPYWTPIESNNMSCIYSSYTIKTSLIDNFKTKSINFQPQFNKTTDKQYVTHKWEISNLEAIVDEEYSLPFENINPKMYLVPIEFQYDGIKGSNASWKDFGNWISKLNEGRQVLDKPTKNDVLKIVSNCKSDLEKIDSLYKYMQNRTRYVSIQLGIGGWQPFYAQKVTELGYGDCKALSNYMSALLNEAGIISYYTLIKAGQNHTSLLNDFPCNQFNHAILCVPTKLDTIWLECTSQNCPTGYVSSFTSDREALVVNGEMSQILKTPSQSKFNKINRNIKITIDSANIGIIEYSDNYSGDIYDKYLDLINAPLKAKKEFLQKKLDNTFLDSISLSAIQFSSKLPSLKIEANCKTNKLTSELLDKLILEQPKSKIIPVSKNIFERQTDIYLPESMCYNDTITFVLTEKKYFQNNPDKTSYKNAIGSWNYLLEINKNKAVITKSLIINQGIYSKTEYSNFSELIEKFIQKENIKLVYNLK